MNVPPGALHRIGGGETGRAAHCEQHIDYADAQLACAGAVPHRSRAQFQRRLDARLCCLDGTTQQQLGALDIRRGSRQPHWNTGKPASKCRRPGLVLGHLQNNSTRLGSTQNWG